MAFDYKKEYKEFYMPKAKPEVVNVPEMRFVAVQGAGDPNEEGGAYKKAVEMLYSVAYTIKMSKMGSHKMDGYFDFVVPPLEGLWGQKGVEGVNLDDKSTFEWVSMIRIPDFVTPEEFEWAKAEAARKKGLDLEKVQYRVMEEGLCIQCLHVGPYDDEPATMALMEQFAAAEGYAEDHSDERRHHEIYLSDPRKTLPERLKTVLRMPVKKA